jgi:hypothetical protein
MAATRGFQAIAGIATESTYGTEVEVTRKLRYVSDSLDKNFAPIENEALLGTAARGKSDQGIATVSGDLVTEWDYTTSDLLFSRFFGTFGTGDYTLDDTIDDKGFTLALGKVVDEHVFTGCKATQLVISGAPGQVMQCTWSLFPQNRVLASSTNTQAILNALAEPSAQRILFHHLNGAFLIGDLTDALTGSDAYKINNFSLTITRNFTQYHATSQTPEQAVEDGFQEVMLEVTLPLYEDNFFVNAHVNHTALQAKVTWTGSSNTKILRIPNMRVLSAPVPVDGPGLIPRTVTFSCYNDLPNDNAVVEMNFTKALKLSET